jgi:rhodanese-related sulfurtransferase
VIGVHPSEGHDIPGVRSIRQLQQTEFFLPDEYDGTVEVDNQEAYELALRLNREESIPAGPSSGMALAGALATIADRPHNRVVVVFPDSAFKYASSVARHIVGLTGESRRQKSRREGLFDAMIEHTRHNPHLTIDVDPAHEKWQTGRVFVLDVRQPEEFSRGHVPGAVNIPLLDLPDHVEQLPTDFDTPILTVCQRGNISLPGVLYLNSLGYNDARSVNGGTNAWTEIGFETETGL